MNCPICNSSNITSKTIDYNSPFKTSMGDAIVISNVRVQECSDCHETWMTAKEKNSLNDKLSKFAHLYQ